MTQVCLGRIMLSRMQYRRFSAPQPLSINTDYAVGMQQVSAASVSIHQYDVAQPTHFQPNGLGATYYAALSTGGAAFVPQNSGMRRYLIWARGEPSRRWRAAGRRGPHWAQPDCGGLMSYLGSYALDDVCTFYANTHTPSTGAAVDADTPPAYRVYEEVTGTPIVTGTMALLDAANTAGFYSGQVTLSAANGFEVGQRLRHSDCAWWWAGRLGWTCNGSNWAPKSMCGCWAATASRQPISRILPTRGMIRRPTKCRAWCWSIPSTTYSGNTLADWRQLRRSGAAGAGLTAPRRCPPGARWMLAMTSRASQASVDAVTARLPTALVQWPHGQQRGRLSWEHAPERRCLPARE